MDEKGRCTSTDCPLFRSDPALRMLSDVGEDAAVHIEDLPVGEVGRAGCQEDGRVHQVLGGPGESRGQAMPAILFHAFHDAGFVVGSKDSRTEKLIAITEVFQEALLQLQ